MPNTKQLKEEVDASQSLELVTEALGEVSALELKGTRDSIQHTSTFFGEITAVYKAVQLMAEKKRLLANLASQKNGKTVSILLTSNSQFHGGLDTELTDFFAGGTKKYPTDRIVIGHSGINYLSSSGYKLPFESVVFSKDIPSSAEITDLVKRTHDYSRILVYHSKFVTVLNQQPEVSDLSNMEVKPDDKTQTIDYILEPELEKMLLFFEGQILQSLIESLFLDGELAKTAARMVAMDQAQLAAEKIVEREKAQLLKVKKNIQNIRILETYTQVRSLGERER